MKNRDQIRREVWVKLRDFALPDSRFHYNFAEFIPDFVGSDAGLEQLVQLSVYQEARFLFITPDNCLTRLRERALLDGKQIVVSTYGIYHGLILLSPEMVPPGQERFASWLDGLEAYGRQVTLQDLKHLPAFNLLVTGASAVSTDGIRFGKGHGFFDVEWGMFSSIGVVDDNTPIVTFVHDVQVVDERLEPGKTDTIVDYIVTPTRFFYVPRVHPRPKEIYWDLLEPTLLENIPPLQELLRM